MSYNYNWFLFILKFIKNFSLSFFDLIFYKIYNLFFNSYFKKKKSNKINCFHSFGYNFKSLNHKDYIDRLYGKTTYNYVISNSYLRFSDFFKIYILTIYKLFFVWRFCEKNNNLFFINKTNCGTILKPLIYDSFCGFIQSSLIMSLSLRNFLSKKKNKKLYYL